MATNSPRIALIHATALAMAPVNAVFEARWPEAVRMNLLDDSLSADLTRAGAMTEALIERFIALARYARDQDAQAILFTCSAFGPAIDTARQAVGLPTLKPNEALLDEALDLCARRGGPHRVGLLTTFAPAARPMLADLQAMARERGQVIESQTVCVTTALDALNGGDPPAAHNRLLAEQAHSLAGCDVVLLGQFSMARARQAVADATGRSVLTGPDSAVRRLRRHLGADPDA